jgi:hypothetical protein
VGFSARVDRLTHLAARWATPPPTNIIAIIVELRAIFAGVLDRLPPEERASAEAFVNLPNRAFMAAFRDDLDAQGIDTQGIDWAMIDRELANIDRALLFDEHDECSGWVAR